MEKGFYTRNEIFSQPEAWTDALDVVDQKRSEIKALLSTDFDQVVFTGCGSTYYLSMAAAALYQAQTGRLARAVPAGELLLNGESTLAQASSRNTLLVAVSRSGETTETLRAVEKFKQQQCGPVLVITNYGDEPLAGMADLAFVISKGQEESLAQTRSFASMYLSSVAFSLLAAGKDSEYQSLRNLPSLGSRLLAEYDALAKKVGENLEIDRFYFLGSGSRYGLACEVSLKMKEMTITHSEPFHFLEFRHGPMSMVNQNTVIVGLLSEQNYKHETDVLNEMRALGGNVFSLAEANADVCLQSGLPEVARNVLYLPVLQLMAYYRSLAKGLNPDRPSNLTMVIKLNL
ncbi:MAG: SIS domain-containing protein [Chloroflexi bacterium HGW-Chloroflexi-10]|nr:MAG: SIS domain-containing protein [Chloroflexi bacterium HGW-Chloroflexi-10]